MSISYQNGNLIKMATLGKFDAIIHCCNCHHKMGAGIAKEIARVFPDAYKADLLTPYGDYNKMGTYSFAEIELPNKFMLIVINAYMQFRYGRDSRYVDYMFVETVLKSINKDFKGKRIGTYYLGCGNAGGEPEVIREIIEKTLTDVKVTVVD